MYSVLQTLLEYAPLLSAVMAALTALIWIVYLNFFLLSYRRQRRPSILITSGAGRGLDTHCFVTNLGLEPVYLLDVVLDLERPDGNTLRAIIPERNEHWQDTQHSDTDDVHSATNLGPLRSGEEKDLGRFRTMIDRACAENPEVDADMPLSGLEVTVVTITASQAELCGAARRYRIEDGADGSTQLRPVTVQARQLQGYFAQKRLERVLSEHLGQGLD